MLLGPLGLAGTSSMIHTKGKNLSECWSSLNLVGRGCSKLLDAGKREKKSLTYRTGVRLGAT